MNIGLDLDGVVYPWHDSIYRHFRETKGFEGSDREFWEWFVNNVPRDVADYYVRIPLFYLDTSPTEDVMEFVPKIAEIATIFYITARPSEAKWATKKFFNNYQLPFSENVIFSEDKANYVRLNKIGYFLDDRAKHVEELKNICNVYLFKAVHNWQYRDQYSTINSMKEFYEILRSKIS